MLSHKHSIGAIQKRQRLLIIEYSVSVVILILLCTLSALRAENIGNDTATYLSDFKTILQYEKSNQHEFFEPGYLLFCHILASISQNPQSLLIATSIFCYLFYMNYIYKECERPIAMTILYFIFIYSAVLNIVREMMAIAVLLPAFRIIKNKSGFWWMILSVAIIVIAAQFHTVAYTMLLLIPLKHIKYNHYFGIAFLCIIAALSLFTSVFVEFFKWLIPEYAGYMETERVGSGQLGTTIQLFRLLLLVIVLFLLKPEEFMGKKQNNLMNWNIFLLLLFQIFSYVMNNISRVSTIFLIPLLVHVVNAGNHFTSKYGKVYEACLVVGLFAIFILFQALRPEWNYIYPYKFFWQ